MNKRPATIYKHTALGPSAHFTRSLVAPVKPRLQLRPLAHHFPVFLGSLWRQADFAMLLGQRAYSGSWKNQQCTVLPVIAL